MPLRFYLWSKKARWERERIAIVLIKIFDPGFVRAPTLRISSKFNEEIA